MLQKVFQKNVKKQKKILHGRENSYVHICCYKINKLQIKMFINIDYSTKTHIILWYKQKNIFCRGEKYKDLNYKFYDKLMKWQSPNGTVN